MGMEIVIRFNWMKNMKMDNLLLAAMLWFSVPSSMQTSICTLDKDKIMICSAAAKGDGHPRHRGSRTRQGRGSHSATCHTSWISRNVSSLRVFKHCTRPEDFVPHESIAMLGPPS